MGSRHERDARHSTQFASVFAFPLDASVANRQLLHGRKAQNARLPAPRDQNINALSEHNASSYFSLKAIKRNLVRGSRTFIFISLGNDPNDKTQIIEACFTKI